MVKKNSAGQICASVSLISAIARVKYSTLSRHPKKRLNIVRYLYSIQKLSIQCVRVDLPWWHRCPERATSWPLGYEVRVAGTPLLLSRRLAGPVYWQTPTAPHLAARPLPTSS